MRYKNRIKNGKKIHPDSSSGRVIFLMFYWFVVCGLWSTRMIKIKTTYFCLFFVTQQRSGSLFYITVKGEKRPTKDYTQ